MTIRILSGDIFKSKANCLVNPVNLVGVSGAGLALQFKKRFPDNFSRYQRFCNTRDESDYCYIVYQSQYSNTGIYIANIATKTHWKRDSNISFIEKGLTQFVFTVNMYLSHEINLVALPALGCGLGNLSWDEVKPMMIRVLSELEVDADLYKPKGN